VVYDSHLIISKALTYCWKLRTIESIEMSYGAALPNAELVHLINALIDSHRIRDTIMKPNSGFYQRRYYDTPGGEETNPTLGPLTVITHR
jgi:hypothetical protein